MGRDLLEDLLEPRVRGDVLTTLRVREVEPRLPGVVADEPFEALGLERQKVGDGQCFRDVREAQSACAPTGLGAQFSQGRYLRAGKGCGSSRDRVVGERLVNTLKRPVRARADRNMKAEGMSVSAKNHLTPRAPGCPVASACRLACVVGLDGSARPPGHAGCRCRDNGAREHTQPPPLERPARRDALRVDRAGSSSSTARRSRTSTPIAPSCSSTSTCSRSGT